MYLLDTEMLSELRKRRSGTIDAAVEAWIATVDKVELFLSVVSIMDVERAIALLEPRSPHQANVLRQWLHEKVLPTFNGRIIPIDAAIALRRACLSVPGTATEQHAWIAASGLVHRMTIVTRSVSAFTGTGTTILDPGAFQPH